MKYRYYSTQRPVTPGAYPKPKGNKVIDIYNFESKEFLQDIKRLAWGYVEYEKPLNSEDIGNYELAPAPFF